MIENVLNLQLQRMHTFKDRLFEKSQGIEDLNEKMRFLFKTMHAINKLDYWTQLYNKFKESRANDQWDPVPVLENSEKILKEVINEDVPQG